MAAPHLSSQGLTTRAAANSDEFQIDIEEGITGLQDQVRRLRDVAKEIGTEAKNQNDLVNQLQMTVIRAQAGVKNNMRRLNKSIVKEGSNHVMHVVLFALLLFFVVYFWSKFNFYR